MKKLYHPAVYAQLIESRQELAEAFEQKDAALAERLSAQIDQLQLEYWTEQCLDKAC